MTDPIFVVTFICALLISITTVLHYEVLRSLNSYLPAFSMPRRSKLLVVIFASMGAHLAEIIVYGLAYFSLSSFMALGTLSGGAMEPTLTTFIYFSAETYTSLGLGDLTPIGPIRLVVGVEALNGLVLIGWTASYTYIAMAKFWQEDT